MIRSPTLRAGFAGGSLLAMLRMVVLLSIILFSLAFAVNNSVLRALSNGYTGDFWLFYSAGRVWDQNLDPYDGRILQAQRLDPFGVPSSAASSSLETENPI